MAETLHHFIWLVPCLAIAAILFLSAASTPAQAASFGQPVTQIPATATAQASPLPPRPTSPSRPYSYPALAYPGANTRPPPLPSLTVGSPVPYQGSSAPNPAPSGTANAFAANLGNLALLAFGVGVVVALGLLVWPLAVAAWPLALGAARRALALARTPAGRVALAVLFIGSAGFAAYEMIWAPVWPVPAGSPLAQELWAVYTGAQAAETRVLCQHAPVSVLADYYADTPDYGGLSPSERDRITQDFGPSALIGAGLFTSQQVQDIALRASIDCQGPVLALDSPIGFWINSFSDLAVVRVSPLGCNDGQLDRVLRLFGGRWKMVAQRMHEPCHGMG